MRSNLVIMLAPFVHLLPGIFQGKKPEALEKLQYLYEKTVNGGTQPNIIRIRIHQTIAAATQESALEFLADALKRTEPEGYIRTFGDEPIGKDRCFD